MKRTRNVLLLVLAVLLLFPWTIAAAGTEIIGTVDTEENALISARLEAMAEEYVTKYIHTAYLYEDEDFVTGTLLELSEETLAETGVTTLNIDGTDTAVEDLTANLSHFEDVAEYYCYTNSVKGYVRENLKITVSDIKTEISEDAAKVELYTLVSFKYSDFNDPTYRGCSYRVYFVKLDSGWYIADIWSEELYYDAMTRDVFDCEEAIQRFNENNNNVSDKADMVEVNDVAEPYNLDTARNIFFSYNKQNAICYANTYALHFNENFTNYTSAGGNCQNFASQCVWAGLCGNNSETAISGRNYPMDIVDGMNSSSGNYLWYENGDWGHDPGKSWITCGGFRNYVESNASNTTNMTLKALKYDVNTFAGLSNYLISLNNIAGSVLHVQGRDENGLVTRGHAIFLTSASSMDPDDITYCGNTSPAMNERLGAKEEYVDNPVTLIIPRNFQVVYPQCTTHTYAPMESVPGGYSTKCSVCQRSNLRIETEMTGPIPRGTTWTITGIANYECYRMAINIKHTDGTNIWDTFYNTDTATKTFTFEVSGIYTINIAARDADESIDGTSNGTNRIFTIRVE